MTTDTLAISRGSERWIAFGPYYAMFPVGFALETVRRYTEPGDAVLDPFAGRGTSVAAAVALGRSAFGVEINPVGWLYAQTKTAPAPETEVIRRLEEVVEAAPEFAHEADDLPEFYHWCFSGPVRRFLVAAKTLLRWLENDIDSTLMAFILLYLHGKRGQSLSNQTRQQKSLAPDYSVRWWKKRGMEPPEINPATFLASRIRWRYKRGTPEPGLAGVHLGDARQVLPAHQPPRGAYKLLLTSPPYRDVTCYYYDHWLRLWVLGGPELPRRAVAGEWARESRHTDRMKYRQLLHDVFASAAQFMAEDAVVYVRTDAREFTRQVTEAVLREIFCDRRFQTIAVPRGKPSQTELFKNTPSQDGEVDIIITP